MIVQYVNAASAEINQKIKTLTDSLILNTHSNYEQVQHITGQIAGLKYGRDALVSVMSQDLEEDEINDLE
jgi:hypothetical protein